MLHSSMNGRTDMLKMISVPSNARSGSTAATEQTQMHSFGGTFNKLKPQLEEILSVNNDIMEPSISPYEW
jgi:hypothetical protein